MGVWKPLALASLAAGSALNVAHAADLLLPPPPMVEARYAEPESGLFNGWYLRGDAGADILQLRGSSSSFTNTNGFLNASGGRPQGFAYGSEKLDATVSLGGGFGYQFNHFFRADLTGEYHIGSSYLGMATAGGCGAVNCVDKYTGKISSAVFLANGYVDLGTWYHLTTYVGAGVGVAVNTAAPVKDYNLGFNGTLAGVGVSSNTTPSFAYALMAGVAYSLTSNIKLDLGYRYLDMGKTKAAAIQCFVAPCFYEQQQHHLSSQEIRLGVRYVFNEELPPPPPPPLVRKY